MSNPEGGWKVDLIVRNGRPFSETEFGRRQKAELLGVEVSLATIEDVLLSKLEWSRLGDSELQRRDVLQLRGLSTVGSVHFSTVVDNRRLAVAP